MADRLDVVTVRVEDESTVIARVIVSTDAGRAIVAAAGFQGRVIEGANLRAALGDERDVDVGRRIAPSGEPELRLAVLAEAGKARPLHDHSDSKRRQSLDIE